MTRQLYWMIQVSVLWFGAVLCTLAAIYGGHALLWAPAAIVLTLAWLGWYRWGKLVLRSVSNQYQWTAHMANQWLSNHGIHQDNCRLDRGKACSCGLAQVQEMIKRAV